MPSLTFPSLAPLLQWVLPQNCLLCKQRSQSALALCTACAHELPWLKHTCQHCAKPLPAASARHALCGGCAKKLPAFRQTIAVFAYEAPIDRLIMQLKFQHQLQLGKLLGSLMAEKIRQTYQTDALPEALIAVPLHSKRLKERGFNQALELAHVLAKTLKIPLLRHVCTRIRHTQAQTQVKATKRHSNVYRAFEYNSKQPLKHVAIVDDVMTTGSTTNELAHCLKKAGVETVDIWVAARTHYR